MRGVTGKSKGVGIGLLAACTVFGCGGTALAADPAADPAEALRAEVVRLIERLEQAEQRIEVLETANEKMAQSLSSDRLSEDEPELVTRLKAVETQAQSIQEHARQVEALSGISVEAALTGVVQQVDADGSATGEDETRQNYRGDVSITLPGGSLGNADGTVFAQMRFGQGEGVMTRPTYTSTPNTTAFEVSGVDNPDSSFAILAQVWYQLDVPLPLGGYKPSSRQRLVFNVGKIDPFIFFDQNAIADDETRGFMNNAFVHNPLLDSGGDIGADEYGYSPGARLAYFNESNSAMVWGVSVGAFGTETEEDSAADFSGSPDRPLLIGQLEASTHLIRGYAGNYRAYVWRNGRVDEFDGATDAHSGWGVSLDQRVSDSLTLFGRYGQRVSGDAPFDRALTLGAELDGNAWRRSADGVGLALGLLHTDPAYRRATAADVTLAGYAADGAERVAELFYRYHVNENIEITPNLQFIGNAGGDDGASDTLVFGLRAQLGL